MLHLYAYIYINKTKRNKEATQPQIVTQPRHIELLPQISPFTIVTENLFNLLGILYYTS